MNKISVLILICVFFNCTNKDKNYDNIKSTESIKLDSIKVDRKKTELVLVYIGDSNCIACNNENVPIAFRKISHDLNTLATENDLGFRKVGLSLDYNIIDGLKHLSSVGVFDEISTGNYYGNIYADKFIWSKQNAVDYARTPQVILFRRDYKTSKDSMPSYFVETEEVLFRRMGISNISNFSNEVYSSTLESLEK